MDQPPFKLRILGPTELLGQAPGAGEAVVRQPKRLALLAYLALSTADGFRRRDKVTALFWPELDQAQSRTYLRKALHGISEALGADIFVTRGDDEVRLDSAKVACDAVSLLEHASAGRWSDALALHRGDLLEGLFPEGVAQEFQEWLDHERRVLRERAATAAWECSRIEDERGDRKAAAVLARRALELTPDDEVGVRRLMNLLDRQGDRAGGLRVYSEWQARLQKEYGVEPAPETRKLARRIQAARKGESHETPPTATAGTASAPGPVPDHPHADEPQRHFEVARKYWLGAAVVLIGAVGVAITLTRTHSAESGLEGRSVAVLPLRDIGGAGEGNDAERMTEELTTALAELRTLTVRPSSPVPDTLERGSDLSRIGRRLGVAFVVDGAVQRGPSRLRVTLRLVRTSDGVTVWASSYDETITDPMASARHVAGEASQQILRRFQDGALRAP
jgi:DNA-binding SARP family transcriptional activator/TolB-like protein